MIDRPIFIAGLDRTGKTPMRIAIERSASIALARRAELWTTHHGRDADLADDAVAIDVLAGLLRDRHVAAQVHDPIRLQRDLLGGARTHAHLFALVGRQHAEQTGRRRWGDQTALIERHAPEILDSFPEARFVHMLRDPRDRFAASLAGGGIGRGGLSTACEEWLESAVLGERHAAAHPDRYRLVRFEDLARDPRDTLNRVLAFIGEPALAADGDSSVPERLVAGIGLYRSALSARAVALIETRCGPRMLQHGYRADSPALGAMDRLRLALVDRPLAAASLLAWRARAGRQRARRTIPATRAPRAGEA
ncbi:MAG: sulfotransferase [Candidatus Limnocylindria bacterium]